MAPIFPREAWVRLVALVLMKTVKGRRNGGDCELQMDAGQPGLSVLARPKGGGAALAQRLFSLSIRWDRRLGALQPAWNRTPIHTASPLRARCSPGDCSCWGLGGHPPVFCALVHPVILPSKFSLLPPQSSTPSRDDDTFKPAAMRNLPLTLVWPSQCRYRRLPSGGRPT